MYAPPSRLTHAIGALLALVSLALVAAGCATGAGSGSGSSGDGAGSPGTEYYYGTSTTTSPDGKIPYGPPVMTLLRRDIDPEEGRIVETALRDGKRVVLTLEQESGARFSAHSSDNSVDGEVEFVGDDWDWSQWHFAFELTDGSGVIEGASRVDGRWLETDRYLTAPSGERRSRITDRLARITREEYERRLTEMTAATPRPAGKRR